MPGLNLRFLSTADCRLWTPIDDRVMGGVSNSALEFSGDRTGVFRGIVSFENSGGFASVRLTTPGLSIEGAHGIRLRVRGDGKRYKISLRNGMAFDDVLYQAPFETSKDAWETIDLPLAGFKPTFRGRIVGDAEKLDCGDIASIGLMISEKQDGPFRLEIESIETW